MTFALCYLAADARIFGADVTAWNEVYHGELPATEKEIQRVHNSGIFGFRQRVLIYEPVREHLSCYFCMSVWAGPLAHIILWYCSQQAAAGWLNHYFLQHANTQTGWSLGLLCAFLLGAPSSYIINAVLYRIESFS